MTIHFDTTLNAYQQGAWHILSIRSSLFTNSCEFFKTRMKAEIYYPVSRKMRVSPKTHEVSEVVTTVFGTAYLFVDFKGPAQWHVIRQCAGYITTLKNAGKPFLLSLAEIDSLRIREERGEFNTLIDPRDVVLHSLINSKVKVPYGPYFNMKDVRVLKIRGENCYLGITILGKLNVKAFPLVDIFPELNPSVIKRAHQSPEKFYGDD